VLCGRMGGGSPSAQWPEMMQRWAFIPICVSTLKVLQYSIQLFPNTSAFVVDPTKRQDFTFFRDQFLPVMNPKFYTSLLFQIFLGVGKAQCVKVRSSLVLSKVPFLPTPQWMCLSLCLPGTENLVCINLCSQQECECYLGDTFLMVTGHSVLMTGNY
jgi:hypothetical protein